MITQTSLTLLEAMRSASNEAAWREFYRRYSQMLLGFAARLGLSEADALDAVQETILAVSKAFRELSGPFDRSKGRFKAWLKGIVVHKVQAIRRGNHRLPTPLETEHLERERRPGGESVDLELELFFEEEWEQNSLRLALNQVAQEVEPATFQAFEHYALRGEPARKVADLLGMSRNAVFLSKHKIIKRLRARVEELRRDED